MSDESKSQKTFVRIIALVVLGWIVSIPILCLLFDKPVTVGEFGDMFGAINSLFSGLAFAGVIYAIILQKEELRLQRKELEMTRKELSRTAEAQEKSEEVLSAQADSLRLTAKLNGLSALLSHHDAAANSSSHNVMSANEANRVAKEINSLIGKGGEFDSLLGSFLTRYK